MNGFFSNGGWGCGCKDIILLLLLLNRCGGCKMGCLSQHLPPLSFLRCCGGGDICGDKRVT